MTSSIKDLVLDLLKETQAPKEMPTLPSCQQSLGRIQRAWDSTNGGRGPLLDVSTQKLLARAVLSIAKSFRVYKRSDPDWNTALESIASLSKQLERAPLQDATLPTDKDTKSASLDCADPATGLPKSVGEYLNRLKRQKKDLYRNPPILPPHAVVVESHRCPQPRRHKVDRSLQFTPGAGSDASTREFIRQFRPNLTPEDVLRGGAFGGTYFRAIDSAVTNRLYSSQEALRDTVPDEWIEGLDAKLLLTSSTYREHVNKYGVKCGGSLGMWESSGWISNVDPYGWFQWYCRFYQGRRCSDDARQISRWLGVAGSKGRFRAQLCNKILAANRADAWKDATISPVIRQTLFHWGLDVTESIVEGHRQRKRT